MKKIWIVGLMAFSLFAVSMNSVVADDEIILTDDEGDVYDLFSDDEAYVIHSENIDIDNIDITSLTYSRNGKIITLKLQVAGNIENRGDIADLLSEDDELIDVATYLFTFLTDGQSYVIYYVNNACQLTEDLLGDGGDTENITDFSVEDDLLTVSFELNSTEEIYEEFSATSMYMYSPDFSDIDIENISDFSEIDLEYLADEIYSESDTENGDTGDTGDDDSGETDNNDDSGGLDNSAILIFIAIIAAICIIGVAAVIFMIRRR